MISETTVLIIGAGPTGLLLAGELCRRGVQCQLIDANPGPLHWDRATIVHPRSLEVFEALGIVEPLLAVGIKQHWARIHSAGRVLGEIDLSICGSRYGFNVGISEETTESILTKHLQQQGGKVDRSSKLVGLERQPPGLLATIEHDGNTEQVLAHYVVGCDGVHSITRTLGGIEMQGPNHTQPWAVFDAALRNWPHEHGDIYGYLDVPLVILTSLPHKRWRVYLRPSSAESDLVADALATLRRYLPDIGFDAVANPTRFQCHTKVAARYRSGRILLAGDAAHVCSPSQGHGMNSGLQDAFNLAWKLALVCQGHAGESLLNSYEAERHPVAKMITASGEEFENAMNLTDPGQRRARDESLRAVFADPKTRHHESIAEAELNIDYSASPIVLGDRHPALAPGHRLPDTIEIRRATGESCLLHELAHRAGHTALVLGGSEAPANALAELHASLHSRGGTPLVEAIFLLAAQTENRPTGFRLTPAAEQQLGIDNLTLLIVRPDGHVGLRADHNHLAAWDAYHTRLLTG